MPTWSEEDLAYAAGFLDGEGCFTAGRHWKITVTCSNTDRDVIQWFKDTFGGSTTLHDRKRKPNHRTIHSWTVVSRDAMRLCCAVAPFLKVKADQAMGLIALQQTMGLPLNGRCIRDDVREERDRIATRLKELKHAG